MNGGNMNGGNTGDYTKLNDSWYELKYKIDGKNAHRMEGESDKIYLIQQFFTPTDYMRLKEVQYCLKKNVQNMNFEKIILLNECIYTHDDLGLTVDDMNRIEQVDIGARLKFSTVLEYVYNTENNLKGYVVFGNSDIFYDETITNVYRTSMSKQNAWYVLLRTELYTKVMMTNSRGVVGYAQDTWIFHTNMKKLDTNKFDFEFGKLGCDNVVAWQCMKQGVGLYNTPLFIKSWHVHKSPKRDYSLTDRLKPPYLIVKPRLDAP